ncbi:MAG: Ca-activated chloride channel [Solirubrobacteraceae bacterium]|nr:Ca-activated chloride channel [Solirubrobacteraceae bacterium]
MSLKDPAFLGLIALLPLGWLLLRLAARRRRRYAVRFPAAGTLAAVLAAPPAWRRRLPAALLALAVAALAVALARPQRTVEVAVEQASVVLVTDASGSMEATDVRPTRLAAAVASAQSFLDKVPPATRVGLVAYSTAPYAAQAPTTNRDLVRATLDSLTADGGTATGDALAAALQALGRNPDVPADPNVRKPPAAIVLLSDGKSMGGRDTDDVARIAGRLHVPIYTVALGTPDGVVPGPFGEAIPVPPDPDQLRRIARSSGGQFFAAEDADRLDAVYKTLGSQLGTKPRRREVTSAFAGLGLLLLVTAGALSVRWRGRLA